MAVRLSQDALPTISKATVPTYDRSQLQPGIVHIGVGNFHRAHQAVYLDQLFEQGRDKEYAIVGAGLMPGDRRMREALASQHYLTTVVEQSATASRARVTGAMIDFAPVADVDAILRRLTDPMTRIVSLTVTEGGYFLNSQGKFEPSLLATENESAAEAGPKTVFGLIATALQRRRLAGHAPFTVMSCDNIPHNGVVARAAVAGVAALQDDALASHIEQDVAFPNAMVDRITPATGEREKNILATDFGIDDAWPVFCEDFSQWVLEDIFSDGRPAFDEVGVEFVSDVSPYEAMKIRILNGGHAVIAYPAGLMGIEFVHQAMQEPLVEAFLRKVESEEIIPTVPPVPNTDIDEYFETIVRRFANPKIGDTVRRLCLDGSNRQPKFIVPTIRDRLNAGGSVEGLALESALWCRYCAGTTDAGETIEPNDPEWAQLNALAKRAKSDPTAWLSMEKVYGDVAREQKFAGSFTKSLSALWNEGTRPVIKRYLDASKNSL
ncbi:MAG: mannitol dehydrogenase family protein [Pseudomonadota bacterium]